MLAVHCSHVPPARIADIESNFQCQINQIGNKWPKWRHHRIIRYYLDEKKITGAHTHPVSVSHDRTRWKHGTTFVLHHNRLSNTWILKWSPLTECHCRFRMAAFADAGLIAFTSLFLFFVRRHFGQYIDSQSHCISVQTPNRYGKRTMNALYMCVNMCVMWMPWLLNWLL